MSESTIVTAAQKKLRALGAVVVKIHGGPMQPDLNDLVGCYRGRSFMLEGKVPGETMTPRQRVRAAQWAKAGAITGMFTSADEAVALVLSNGHTPAPARDSRTGRKAGFDECAGCGQPWPCDASTGDSDGLA